MKRRNGWSALKRIDVLGRHITGLLEAGAYGETANIVKAKTGKTAHRQKTDEAAMLPCFFRLYVPSNQERGILILQRDNRVPAKKILSTLVEEVLKSWNSDMTCEFVPIANKNTYKKLVEEGQVHEIRFVRIGIPPDLSDEYGSGKEEMSGTVTVVVRAARGRILKVKERFRNQLLNGNSAHDIYELPNLENFEYQNIKVKMKIGNKLQDVDFGRGVTQPIIDVTDAVKLDPVSGHPTYESLLYITADLADDDTLTKEGE